MESSISEICTKPSTPSDTSTKMPKSVRFTTVPVISVPRGLFSSRFFHGSSVNCLMPNERRSCSTSILSTFTSISSPLLATSAGLNWRCFQEISDTCTRPSIPSSRPTNIPKSVTLRIDPLTIHPTG